MLTICNCAPTRSICMARIPWICSLIWLLCILCPNQQLKQFYWIQYSHFLLRLAHARAERVTMLSHAGQRLHCSFIFFQGSDHNHISGTNCIISFKLPVDSWELQVVTGSNKRFAPVTNAFSYQLKQLLTPRLCTIYKKLKEVNKTFDRNSCISSIKKNKLL